MVSVISDDLRPSVRERHPVLPTDHPVGVLGLFLVEAGACVLVLYSVSIAEGLGRDLVRVTVAMNRGGVVGWGTSREGQTQAREEGNRTNGRSVLLKK